MEMISIGSSTFKAETLRSMTKKEAQELYPYLDKRLIGSAWDMANPKGKKKPRKKKESNK